MIEPRSRMANKPWTIAVILTILIMGMGIIGYFVADSRAADITYPGNRGSTKLLKDIGDGVHAPARFIGGEQTPEAAVTHFDTGIAVDTYYVLVDLDDTTNYPHANTNKLIIRQVISCALQSGDSYLLTLSVVVDIDGSGATVKPIWSAVLPSSTNAHNGSTIFAGGGIDTEISGSTLVNITTPDVAIAAVTTSTDLDSPAGTVSAEVGDLLVTVDELLGTATLNYWAMGVLYNSE